MRTNSAFLNSLYGVLITLVLAIISRFIADLIPNGYIGASVLAMLIGMALHPIVKRMLSSFVGIDFVAKKLLKYILVKSRWNVRILLLNLLFAFHIKGQNSVKIIINVL